MSNTQRKEDDFLRMVDENRWLIQSLCTVGSHRNGLSVEDLIQEVVSRMWEAWPKYKGRSSQATWVYAVTRNVTSNLSRRRLLSIELRPVEELHNYMEVEDGDARMTERLYSLIDRLEDGEKELILRYIEHEPQADIASSMGITVDAVNRRIRRVKDKLRMMNEKYI